jgi:hypothetical protein
MGVKGQRAPATAWKKGQSGNPAGKPPESPTLRVIKKSSREELSELYDRIHNLDKAELCARLHDPYIKVIEETYIRAIIADMERGDSKTIREMLERIHGQTIRPIVAQVGVKKLEDLIGWEDG